MVEFGYPRRRMAGTLGVVLQAMSDMIQAVDWSVELERWLAPLTVHAQSRVPQSRADVVNAVGARRRIWDGPPVMEPYKRLVNLAKRGLIQAHDRLAAHLGVIRALEVKADSRTVGRCVLREPGPLASQQAAGTKLRHRSRPDRAETAICRRVAHLAARRVCRRPATLLG